MQGLQVEETIFMKKKNKIEIKLKFSILNGPKLQNSYQNDGKSFQNRLTFSFSGRKFSKINKIFNLI